jgi:hypothetical protein
MRYELVALEDEGFGDEGELLLTDLTWRQAERARDEALAEAQEDYDDGRYPYRQLRIQPAA